MHLPASSNLRRLSRYLARYSHSEQPAAFEFLTAATLHRAFHVPFQFGDREDESVEHRVVWYGHIDSESGATCRSPSGADSICFACDCHVLIENTLRGNVANQWRREFVESITHFDDFVGGRSLERGDVYLGLVAPEFHHSTYTGFKQKALEGYNILLLDTSTLYRISQICVSLMSLLHLDLKQLLQRMVKKLRESGSLGRFRKDLNKCVRDWEVELLGQEKTVYFGLKSYEAMRQVGRRIVGISDIMLAFRRDAKLDEYLRKLGGGDLSAYIRQGLTTERLARAVETPHEVLFCRVDSRDFRARGLRLIRAVESRGT